MTSLLLRSHNVQFLAEHDARLVRLGAQAEHYFTDDPNTCLIKLRQFGELLAQLTAAKSGLFSSPDEAQADLLRRLRFERVTPPDVSDLFHHLRRDGNQAIHHHADSHADALAALKIARQLGVWFHRTFGVARFSPGPFVPPPDPAQATRALQAELAQLRQALEASQSDAERARMAAAAEAQERLSADARAHQEREERATWELLATETEQDKAALAAQLRAMQATAAVSTQTTTAVAERAERAAAALDIDEATTRALIDAQLRASGWEADTTTLRYAAGTRPAKGRNLAIAEWPTDKGPADYALFVGLQCIAVVEAKRRHKQVSAEIDQAQRYARGFRFEGGAEPVGGPWPDTSGEPYRVPFVFAANGRPYLRQIETASGIWFRDARRPANHRRALAGWYTPDGLRQELERDVAAAHAALAERPIAFGFPLRPYQKRAIEAVEAALADDRRALLLAMATGTGKTKLAIALLYRLLEAKRFRRVCFVVDRHALGAQAEGEFKTTRIVSTRTFADIFGLEGLETVTPDTETMVHICTIQGLVKRVLYADDPAEAPPVDQYDLMVIDECHRGYLLDRELSETELTFRDQDDYISKYRRVLDYFDAVKIGLTATPALHAVSIFGAPAFTYAYREAVIDGYLIDYEPPVQITTALARSGIAFARGETVEMMQQATGEPDLAVLPDDLTFEVEQFNKRVITKAFNRVVAEELARQIDPLLLGKTLIFAVSDAHADLVVDELKRAFARTYGAIDDAAIRKVTGSVDQVGGLIRAYRNDALPTIAVTVDLLTTGIDVPSIVNLVFLRRVNSRILYDQMVGRATRPARRSTRRPFASSTPSISTPTWKS